MHRRWHRSGLALAATAALSAGPAMAQLDVDEQIETEKEAIESEGFHLAGGWLERMLDRYDRFQERREDLSFYFYLAPMFQLADAPRGAEDQQFNYSLGTFFDWKPVRGASYEGALRIWIDYSRIASGPATKPFSQGLGLEQLVNDNSAKTSKAKIGQLYWDSTIFGGSLDLAVGHMDPFLQFAANPYAYWDRATAVASALSVDVVSPWGDAGLGLIGTLRLPADLYLKLGALDSDADGRYPDFDSVSKGHWQYTAEAGRVGTLGGQKSVLRLAYSEAPKKDEFEGGTGWSLSLAQDLSGSVALWARLADAPRPRQDFERQYGGGVVVKGPYRWSSDQVMLGVMRTVPTDPALREETVLELLWRLQLTPRLRVSPALNLYLDPARDATASRLLVGTLRMFIKI